MALQGRKENWSTNETAALVDGVTERYELIKGKFSPLITNEKKTQAWEEILQSVNACSLTTRDMKSIKKKWVDIQSQARKKEAGRRREQKKTGGGPPPPSLKPWEDKIISMLDVSLITGLEGGYDAAEHPAIPGPSSCAAASTSLEPLKSFALSSSAVDSTPECDPKLQSRKKRPAQDIASTSDLSMSLLDIQKEKLNMKREFLEIEKKKLKVMEGMLQEMKQKNCCCSFPMDPFNQMQSTSKTASCSVSPTIKGLIISEI